LHSFYESILAEINQETKLLQAEEFHKSERLVRKILERLYETRLGGPVKFG